MKEIERKFLVRSVPFLLKKYPVSIIRQGYILISADEDEVRVRHKGDRYFLTIKKGAGLERQEIETEISRQQFEALYPGAAGQSLEKSRFEIPFENWLIELDVFSGKLEGLILAEVEFKTLQDSGIFKPPGWFDKEVTADPRFSNRNLARYGMPI